MADFEALVSEADQREFSGWDFSFIDGRMRTADVSWDYKAAVLNAMQGIQSMLDMGTGGGEFLSSLAPLPKETYATEAYPPNVPVAKGNLGPLGVQVVQIFSDDALPFRNGQFDLVINRHESYAPREVYRILKPGGMLITQQVGGQNELELNERFGVPANEEFAHWNLRYAVNELAEAGFVILEEREEFPETVFTDIGAVVYYLKVIEWQIPGFTVEKYRTQLFDIHLEIEQCGAFRVSGHRFFIQAKKPLIE
jgi:SAM-dependent methyltransferase